MSFSFTHLSKSEISLVIFYALGVLFAILLGFGGKKTLKIAVFISAICTCLVLTYQHLLVYFEKEHHKIVYIVVFLLSLPLASLVIKFLDIGLYLACGAAGFFAFTLLQESAPINSFAQTHGFQEYMKYFAFLGFFIGALAFWKFKKRIYVALTGIGSGILLNFCLFMISLKVFPQEAFWKSLFFMPGLAILSSTIFICYQTFHSKKSSGKDRV